MSYGRRTIDRRRRVLYSAHHADPSDASAARRRTAERLREAKKSAAVYGSRVERRLQGRWFSLVPVRRRTLLGVASALVLLSLLLAAVHYASVAWPWLATRPEIARPLRLDRPDSFGRWIHSLLLAASAGASLLIYQLRRYRLDDYQGHYRIWRIVLLVALAASVNSLTSTVGWAGAILDAVFGQRVALSGQDWIRLVLTIGGAVLALRVTVEVKRSRWALATMITAWGLFAIPAAATWNIVAADRLAGWMLVTSAPLLASTMLLISLGGYLRSLYREVCEIEANEPLLQRGRQFANRLLRRNREEVSEADPELKATAASQRRSRRRRDSDEPADAKNARTRRRWWRRTSPANEPEADVPADQDAESPTRSQRRNGKRPQAPGDEAQDGTAKRPARRWLGLRRAAPAADGNDPSDSDKASRPDAGRGRKTDSKTGPASDNADSQKRSRRFTLGSLRPSGWLRRRQRSETSAEEQSQAAPGPESDGSKSLPRRSEFDAAGTSQAQSEEDLDPSLDPDEIDWSSMSKSQRRRLRKQLKRQGRAA